MKIRRLIRNNLIHYWRKNLLLALGVAISGAVVTGALIVGDSVRYSLDRIVDQRLGSVTHVLTSGDRYFTGQLAGRVGEELGVPAAALLLQEGIAVAGGGARRVNHVQVLGVDPDFDRVTGSGSRFGTLDGDSIILSRNLANRLAIGVGEELLLRVQKASRIPMNAPFVTDAESVVTIRATVRGIADREELGGFSLKVSQTAPFNVFISLDRLREVMDFGDGANVMLLRAGDQTTQEGILAAVRSQFSIRDAGLNIKYLEDQAMIGVKSDRVFIEDTVASLLRNLPIQGTGYLTYFVNRLAAGKASTPYSFVSTLPDSQLGRDGIIINRWLAEDLSAGEGDTISMAYFTVGPLRELKEDSSLFVVRSVVPMEGRFGDRDLMPDLPGLSDAGNCRDWDTGVPIVLGRIRDRDEDYWDRYGGTPKAFISLSRGVELWHNRFGSYTSFRYAAEEGSAQVLQPDDAPGDTNDGLSLLTRSILDRLDPATLGFKLEAARSRGLEAAAGGVDFSQLFGGLSFFLMAAGILLTVLLFLLNLESREAQLKLLVTLGIPVRIIRRITLAETMLVALFGSLAGLGLAVVYNRLVFLALNGVWRDVVRTGMMEIHITGPTLLVGLAITMAVALAALYLPLDRKLKRQFNIFRTGSRMRKQGRRAVQPLLSITGSASGLAALGLVVSQLMKGEVVNAPLFFMAGGLLLLSAVLFFIWNLGRVQRSITSDFRLPALSMKNALRNRTRSISITILFSIGAFMVVSTGSNRKDLFVRAEDPSSGTGGFLYYAESTVPVLQRLNDPAVRYGFGLEEGYSFVQMRRATGDDASCLNLNRVVNPQVLGVDPVQLRDRFSFVTRTPWLDPEDPWGSLELELPGGLIPAIADETVIKWGLGLEVGDTLFYTNSSGGTMKLLLVGGLAPSIFQGNVIISDRRFLEQFPQSSGTTVFLVNGSPADSARIASETGLGLRDLGWDMELTGGRLAEFNSVTNTYLSIFMVMGALGLLVGTFGLVVVLSRSILERRQEIALLKALGYPGPSIRRLITREYMILLTAGITSGFLTAVVATLPSILSPHTGTSFTTILAWLVILVANGWIWIHLITRLSLRNQQIYASLRNE